MRGDYRCVLGRAPSPRGVCRPRGGAERRSLAYRGLRLPPPSRGRIPPGLAGVWRVGLPVCVRVCVRPLPRGVRLLPCAVRAAVCCPPPCRVAAGGDVRARVGPLSPGGASPRVVALGRTRRTDGGSGGAPLAGGPVGWSPGGVGPGSRGGGVPRVLRPAGVPGRRGTALVLVAVGSRARLPGGPACAFVGAPFRPEPLPTRCRPSPAVRPLPVAADLSPLPCPWLAWTAERRAVPSIHSLGTETGLAAVGCCPLPGP